MHNFIICALLLGLTCWTSCHSPAQLFHIFCLSSSFFFPWQIQTDISVTTVSHSLALSFTWCDYYYRYCAQLLDFLFQSSDLPQSISGAWSGSMHNAHIASPALVLCKFVFLCYAKLICVIKVIHISFSFWVGLPHFGFGWWIWNTLIPAYTSKYCNVEWPVILIGYWSWCYFLPSCSSSRFPFWAQPEVALLASLHTNQYEYYYTLEIATSRNF